MDKTKWYSINYEKLAELESDARAFLEPTTVQIGSTVVRDCPIEEDKMSQAREGDGSLVSFFQCIGGWSQCTGFSSH